MPFTFEFFLEGPPVSLNAKEGSPRARRRYREWIQTVKAASVARWPQDKPPLTGTDLQVSITCYHTNAPPDVDNIVKPVLDAMKVTENGGVVYGDDDPISELNSRRVSLATGRLVDVPTIIAEVLDRYDEIVYIRVFAPNEYTESTEPTL